MIDSYSYKRMVVNGEKYTQDLIINPDGTILYPWQRKKEHLLDAEDIMELLNMRPDIIILGTGKFGILKLNGNLDLGEKTELMALPTEGAVFQYNCLIGKKIVGACFHLAC